VGGRGGLLAVTGEARIEAASTNGPLVRLDWAAARVSELEEPHRMGAPWLEGERLAALSAAVPAPYARVIIRRAISASSPGW
jgi:hypothetical protein